MEMTASVAHTHTLPVGQLCCFGHIYIPLMKIDGLLDRLFVLRRVDFEVGQGWNLLRPP